MKKQSIINNKKLVAKEKPLSKVATDYYTAVSKSNNRIANLVNANKIEEGNSIEKARAFVTNM